jgi:hypothetical protein
LSAITLITLIRVKVPNLATPLLYHSDVESGTPVVLYGETYTPASFEVQSYSQSDLSLGSSDIKIAIANTSLLRSLMRQHNDLKKSIVYIFNIQPGTDVPPHGDYAQISTATTEDSMVLFTLRNPTNALVGRLSTKYIEATMFPELPYYKPTL